MGWEWLLVSHAAAELAMGMGERHRAGEQAAAMGKATGSWMHEREVQLDLEFFFSFVGSRSWNVRGGGR